jgi:DNA-directed RNA polymerase specialized sigma subunit
MSWTHGTSGRATLTTPKTPDVRVCGWRSSKRSPSSATRLTPRQRRIVELYFYEGRTQEEIAAELRISQQVVSRQLFGVVRGGKKVGGALKRLRDACAELGIEWV